MTYTWFVRFFSVHPNRPSGPSTTRPRIRDIDALFQGIGTHQDLGDIRRSELEQQAARAPERLQGTRLAGLSGFSLQGTHHPLAFI